MVFEGPSPSSRTSSGQAAGSDFRSPPIPPGEHKCEGYGKSLDALKKFVDQASTERKHVNLNFYRVGQGDPGATFISTEDFMKLCDYIVAKGLKTVPDWEVYEGFTAPAK